MQSSWTAGFGAAAPLARPKARGDAAPQPAVHGFSTAGGGAAICAHSSSAPHRRGRRPSCAGAGDAGPLGSNREEVERSVEAGGVGVRRTLPRRHPADSPPGPKRGPVRLAERSQARGRAAGYRPLLLGPVVRRVAGENSGASRVQPTGRSGPDVAPGGGLEATRADQLLRRARRAAAPPSRHGLRDLRPIKISGPRAALRTGRGPAGRREGDSGEWARRHGRVNRDALWNPKRTP